MHVAHLETIADPQFSDHVRHVRLQRLLARAVRGNVEVSWNLEGVGDEVGHVHTFQIYDTCILTQNRFLKVNHDRVSFRLAWFV